MDKRLKVLISAYACEPGKGSEPGTSWEWIRRLAAQHDLTVLTRLNNRPAIERELSIAAPGTPAPRFVYHDLSPVLQKWKKRVVGGVYWYYLLWQRSAHARVAELVRTESFDLLHHLSFATFRFPTAVWDHAVPCIWGPVAGIENTPLQLLPWRHPAALVGELLRNGLNWWQSSRFSALAERARCSATVLTVSPEMQAAFAKHDCPTVILPTIAVAGIQGTEGRPLSTDRPLRLLFVGRIVCWKGVELAVRGLAASKTCATLTLIGDGPFRAAAEAVARKLGLGQRAEFRGRVPYAEAARIYEQYDVLLFPSIHDSGGNVVLEAMAHGLPVICLDCAGPGYLLPDNAGLKVKLGRRTEIIRDLANAIRHYDRNRDVIPRQGRMARDAIAQNHTWEKRIRRMNEVYQAAIAATRIPNAGNG